MARVFLAKADSDLEKRIQEALAYLDWERIVPSGARVFFKPNLVCPSPREGVTTTPIFIRAVLQSFADRTSNLIVGESDGGYRGWPAEAAFHSHDLPQICRHFGARLVNLSKEPRSQVELRLGRRDLVLGLPSLLLNDIDLLVTLPVPKIHQITTISGAVKNQWGCIPDTMRLVYHPYFDELILEVNRLVKTRLALADGTFFLNRSGPIMGDPVRLDLVLAADAVGAMDVVLCRIMGIEWRCVRHLRVASLHGWVPPDDQIMCNVPPESYRKLVFHYCPTLRSRVVAWAFDRPWAIRLFWDSWFADQFHRVLYALAGNPVDVEKAKMAVTRERT